MPETDRKAPPESERQDIDDHAHLAPRTVYHIVRQEGEDEMERPVTSLWWSGVAAGLSISFSLLTQSVLVAALPHATWTPLVSSFGYCVGFLMVVLARQQLFTETTITLVLPLLAQFSRKRLFLTARMWAIVFAANIAGTLVAALFCWYTPVLSPELRAAMLEISRHTLEPTWIEMLLRGITAGFLIALMIWLIPSAESAEFHVIIVLTYVISAAGFQHIVAGSMESFILIMNGDVSISGALLGFGLPVLLGNIIGGTALFAVISYAQVMHEI